MARGFSLQPRDPFSGRPLGPARSFVPAEDLAASGQQEPPPPAPAAPGAGSPYPEGGNIDAVLAWVNDPSLPDEVQSDRAKAAIVAEHGREKPRKTLLAELSERTG